MPPQSALSSNPSLLKDAINAHRGGNMDEAEGLYRAFLTAHPHNPDALALFGVLLSEKGAHQEAVSMLERAIAADPGAALFQFHMGNILQTAGETIRAVKYYREAVTRQPNFAEGWLNLGRAAEQTGDFELSLAAGKQAVNLQPESAAAHFVTGLALSRLERHAEAESFYKRAIALKPDWLKAWDNLGLTYQFTNRFDEAETTFRKLIDIAGQTLPDEQLATVDERKIGGYHWHLARLELLRGDYRRGFARGRCRLNANGWLDETKIAQPLWRGQDIAGKTVLVFSEGGHGDTLMMARYLPLMRQKGARVILHLKPEMEPFLRGWDGADKIITSGQPIENFDYYLWMFELPFAFGTAMSTIPAAVPYLPQLAPDTDTLLPPETRPRIGVVWSGATERSRIPLKIFAGLFAEKDFAFFSLTRDKNPGDDEILSLHPIQDLAPRLRHFGDLARFTGQMDLIISCDTATPQLTCGLGRKAWILLPFSGDWRWLSGREDSPWYPGMRLFRQSKSGQWEDVITRVKAELRTAQLGSRAHRS